MDRRLAAVVCLTTLAIGAVSFAVSVIRPDYTPAVWIAPSMLAVTGAAVTVLFKGNGNGRNR